VRISCVQLYDHDACNAVTAGLSGADTAATAATKSATNLPAEVCANVLRCAAAKSSAAATATAKQMPGAVYRCSR